ncbi:hypothetical protein V6N11_017245 [Hibiscus sabdariffa]|uniref:Uncharacterized protein n=1 Tax=Hibiscus sabdariffa TaxID=183260 RepID=A0ABR2TXK9_9ROSI
MMSLSSNDTSSLLEIAIGVFGYRETSRSTIIFPFPCFFFSSKFWSDLQRSGLDGGLLLSSMVRDELGLEKAAMEKLGTVAG